MPDWKPLLYRITFLWEGCRKTSYLVLAQNAIDAIEAATAAAQREHGTLPLISVERQAPRWVDTDTHSPDILTDAALAYYQEAGKAAAGGNA